MPLFNVEARRVIEGEFVEIEADSADDAADKVTGMNNDEFMRGIDIVTDEIEVGAIETIIETDE